MFNNIVDIEYLLMLKDNEININFLEMNEIFKQYLNKEVSKSYLLDKHTDRNRLFIEWVKIYDFLSYYRMGFIEEMKDLLKNMANISTVEENIKKYGKSANIDYDYFIDIVLSHQKNEYNIHYDFLYFGSIEYNNILDKYNMSMEYLDGATIGIKKMIYI